MRIHPVLLLLGGPALLAADLVLLAGGSAVLAGCPARAPAVQSPPATDPPTPPTAPPPTATPPLADLRAAATAAYRAQDWPAFVAAQQAVVAADPASTVDRYNLACGYARNGQRDEALAELSGLLERGIDYGVAQDPDLASLQGDPALVAALARYEERYPPVHRATRAFAVGDDPDLAPEGIAHDPATGRFFVGSMRTGAVLVVKDGVAEPFGAVSLDGAPVSAIGMAVDGPRSRLWVVATATDIQRDPDPARIGTTAVVGLDLATGELRETHRRPPGGAGFGFNDLAVAPDGTLYLSGSDVYVLRPGESAPSLLGVDPPIADSNGITLGPQGVLYVSADHQGIARVDLRTRSREWLATPAGLELRPFDGLYYSDGALVGIELGVGRGRVVRVDLDPSGAAVTGVEVLEQRNPEIAGMTTGAVVGGELYFLTRDPVPPGGDPAWGGKAAVWKAPIRLGR